MAPQGAAILVHDRVSGHGSRAGCDVKLRTGRFYISHIFFCLWKNAGLVRFGAKQQTYKLTVLWNKRNGCRSFRHFGKRKQSKLGGSSKHLKPDYLAIDTWILRERKGFCRLQGLSEANLE